MGLMTAVLLFQSRVHFLVSCDMFSSVYITSLKVENMIESDHFPVVITINVAQNPALTVDNSKKVQVNGQTKFSEKIIWQGDKEQIYRDQQQPKRN